MQEAVNSVPAEAFPESVAWKSSRLQYFPRHRRLQNLLKERRPAAFVQSKGPFEFFSSLSLDGQLIGGLHFFVIALYL